ncbi:response regulator [Sphingomonas montanisoli]|uniref:Response regulator n=1 Tax=Sphingomonas montanisoli TaxID=2606412 RepID=A0A5D9C9C2_9SPHN|nr:response regulator [Sphingomonas montanisoli]TZG27996.1 response regulator [Sphingomonas montanisoli]
MLVVCVDDDKLVRQVTSDMIRHLDHQVLEAPDGTSALDLIDCVSDRIDVLLTDVRMPGMNGVSLANAVRHRYPDIGIIYMTGYAGEFELSGPVLEKPCTLGDLEKVLSRARH